MTLTVDVDDFRKLRPQGLRPLTAPAREIQRETRSVPARRAVWQAYRNGNTARWLPGLDYEALFAQPLDQVQQRLGIRPATVYQAVPAGVRSGLKLRA